MTYISGITWGGGLGPPVLEAWWDKFATFTCHLIIAFLDELVCIGDYAISHRFTCMIFFSMNMFVPAISHRYMYFIITMHLLNEL